MTDEAPDTVSVIIRQELVLTQDHLEEIARKVQTILLKKARKGLITDTPKSSEET